VITYYALYLAACALLVPALLVVLHRAGDLLLKDASGGRAEFARSIRRLLDIGYFLVSLGYVTLTAQTEMPLQNYAQMTTILSIKLGLFLLLLGALHLVNMLLLALFRSRTAVLQAS
jgi:hypothetical protein